MQEAGYVPGGCSREGDHLVSREELSDVRIQPFDYLGIVASMMPSIPFSLCDMPMNASSQ